MDTRSRESATMSAELPQPRSVRFSDEDLEILTDLLRRLHLNQRQVIAMALRHLRVTLDRGEHVHLEIPPEEDSERPAGSLNQ